MVHPAMTAWQRYAQPQKHLLKLLVIVFSNLPHNNEYRDRDENKPEKELAD